MTTPPAQRGWRRVALAAGLMDASTGVALVWAPALVLAGLRVPPVGPEATLFLRWVGVFVGGVGAGYLWALVRGGEERLRDVFELTCLLRALVGGFVTIAVLRGALAAGWTLVAVTDLGLALVQAWLLGREAGSHG